MPNDRVSIHYLEDRKTYEWMTRNLGRKEQSRFIREAVSEKIMEEINRKNIKKAVKSKVKNGV